MADSFEILGIARGVSADEARRAYRELARRWHPDRFLEGPERMWAEQKMTEINNAYHEALKGPSGLSETDTQPLSKKM